MSDELQRDKGAHVYWAITEVTGALAAMGGIAKLGKNTQQNYAFRGIDDVYNALAPLLAAHRLCILPRVMTRQVTERTTKSQTTLFSVVLEVELNLVSAVDSSRHTIRTVGEAMDSGDKATNKAMAAAFKYMAMMAFCIPTEGEADHDADATTHEVAAAPSGFAVWLEHYEALASQGTAAIATEWQRANPDYRRYLSATYPDKQAEIKRKAAAVV